MQRYLASLLPGTRRIPAFPASVARYISTKVVRQCPKCGSPLTTPLPTCTSCFSIERIPRNASFHELLQQDPSNFDLKASSLKSAFVAAQRVCHPDKWSAQPQELQELAAEQSSLLNKAYKTLSSPRLRGEYILAQHGIEVNEHDKLDVDDMELMDEVMEMWQTLEETESSSNLEEMSGDVEGRLAITTIELKDALSAEKWLDAKAAVIRLRYLENIHDAVKAKLDKL